MKGDTGVLANSVLQIPLQGWKEITIRLVVNFFRHRTLLASAGVTYFLILSFVPALTAWVALYGLFANSELAAFHIELLSGVLPPGGVEILQLQLDRLDNSSWTSLLSTLGVAATISLVSATAGMKALFDAMNIAYTETESRNFVVVRLIAFACALAGLSACSVGLALTIAQYGDAGNVSAGTVQRLFQSRLVGFSAILVLAALGLLLLYRYGPDRKSAKWRWIVPGVVVAIPLLAGLFGLFTWYITSVNDYEAAYGAFGPMIALLTWIWLSTTIVVFGAQVNSEIERQTSRDTTTGPEQSLGQRGAAASDTVDAKEAST